MPPVIQLDQVSKRFGQVQALDNVSLTVEPGTVLALLGANGAGKSTAIRTLLGLERPDSGRAAVLGMESYQYSQEIRRSIGYVAEKPSLYDWMTVEETGWFAAGFYAPGYQAEYDRYTKRFGLRPDQRVGELSKGTRAKVALALALAHSPPLLILDEPTSGLDPLVRREFLESMMDVAAEGRTVLLCSHQVSEVERVADQVAILINGELICCERLEDLKRETRELLITLPEEKTPLPAIPGKIFAHVPFKYEHVVMVRELDESRLPEQLSGFPYEVRHPNLEEILLALLRERRAPVKQQPNHESPVV